GSVAQSVPRSAGGVNSSAARAWYRQLTPAARQRPSRVPGRDRPFRPARLEGPPRAWDPEQETEMRPRHLRLPLALCALLASASPGRPAADEPIFPPKGDIPASFDVADASFDYV